jgi:allantoin racemase
MKLWYQSMSRQTEWGGYPRVLREILDRVRDPDTEIHVAGITEIGGTGDQFRYLEYLETGEVLKNVQQAMREGYDAFLIGNIADPGLHAAREIANVPVLGLCESAMHMACMMGANFSFVTINEKFTPRIIENVARYGLRERFAGANRMRIERITDLGPGFDNPEAQARILAQFNEAARKNTESGAEVVIAAGGVVMALLAHAGVYETEDGVPILNGIITSKKCAYAPPPPDQIETFRKFYGADIYPTVKPP